MLERQAQCTKRAWERRPTWMQKRNLGPITTEFVREQGAQGIETATMVPFRDDKTPHAGLGRYTESFNFLPLMWLQHVGIDADAYIQEILKLGSPRLIQTLLDQTAVGNPDLFARMQQEFRRQDSEKITQDIKERNLQFYDAALFAIAIAAACGNEVYYSWELSKRRPFTAKKAMFEMGGFFGIQVRNSDELIERIRILFPPSSDKDTQSRSAMYFLVANNAFEVHNDKRGLLHCPAPLLTRRIFATYGDLLHTDEYAASFKQRMTLQPLQDA